MAYVQLKNITAMAVSVHAADRSSVLIQPLSVATVSDKFVFQLDVSKVRLLPTPGENPHVKTVLVAKPASPVTNTAAKADPNGTGPNRVMAPAGGTVSNTPLTGTGSAANNSSVA